MTHAEAVVCGLPSAREQNRGRPLWVVRKQRIRLKHNIHTYTMANSNKKNNKMTKKKKTSAGRGGGRNMSAPARRVMASMDAGAVAWAKLLANPCGAKLVHPCYAGGSGASTLVRLESDTVLAATGGETGIFGMFIPGQGVFLNNVTPILTDLGLSQYSVNDISNPGDSYVKSCSSMRAVAACMQITYPGTEASRSGVVGIGVCDASAVAVFSTTAMGGGGLNMQMNRSRVACEHVQRMPQEVVECKWFPGNADEEAFALPLPADFARNLGGHNGIQFSVSGFPAGVGIRIRCVVVYEAAMGAFASGQVQVVEPPVSLTTSATVISALTARSPQWYLNKAEAAIDYTASFIDYARQGGKLVQRVAQGVALLTM